MGSLSSEDVPRLGSIARRASLIFRNVDKNDDYVVDAHVLGRKHMATQAAPTMMTTFNSRNSEFE